MSSSRSGAPMEDDAVAACLRRLKGGDPDAAGELWRLYSHRLVALARVKLGGLPRRATDEEDIAQSTFQSFCWRAQDGQYPDLADAAGLWALLATITARKAANQRTYEYRDRRNTGRMVSPDDLAQTESGVESFGYLAGDEPSPDETTVFTSELERFMDTLDEPAHRLILLWKLEDRTNSEIARYLDCSVSTIERSLRHIRKRLNCEIDSANS